MSLKEKYAEVLSLGEELGVSDGFVEEEDGVLTVGGTVRTQEEAQALQSKIDEISQGEADIAADLTIEFPELLAIYTVKKGDTLSKIAKQYYGDGSQYPKIFDANTDILEHPDRIDIDQELKIPE